MRHLRAATLAAALIGSAVAFGASAQETPATAGNAATSAEPSAAEKAETYRQADAAAEKAKEESAKQKTMGRHCMQTGSRLPGNCDAGQQADPRAILNNRQLTGAPHI